MAAIGGQGIEPIDLVVVNLYPFEDAASAARRLPDDVLEQIDVGGPSLLRAAAKNYAGVAVLCDATSYGRFLEEFERLDGEVTLELRRQLAAQAFAHTAAYDLHVASAFGVSPVAFPESLVTGGRSSTRSATVRIPTSVPPSIPTPFGQRESRPHASFKARSSPSTTFSTWTPRGACAQMSDAPSGPRTRAEWPRGCPSASW